MKKIFALFLPGLVIIAVGVYFFVRSQSNNSTSNITDTTKTTLANPASVYCQENGGKLEIRKDSQGNETGFCLFVNGSECEEWAYFRKECPVNQTAGTVPLPTGEDVIRTFVSLINEGRAAEAVGMLNPALTADESAKQAWGVQFNSFSTLTPTKIEKTLTADSTEIYKVILDAKMKPEAASAPIPYYGWNDGENTRWITLQKVDKFWKITGIATGP